jgi:hypothetical protein
MSALPQSPPMIVDRDRLRGDREAQVKDCMDVDRQLDRDEGDQAKDGVNRTWGARLSVQTGLNSKVRGTEYAPNGHLQGERLRSGKPRRN